MAFCVENIVPFAGVQGGGQRSLTMTSGMLVYFGVTRVESLCCDLSYVAYVVYLMGTIILFLLKAPDLCVPSVLGPCRQLRDALDALDIGLVVCREREIIANDRIFDLLRLERTDVSRLRQVLALQLPPSDFKPGIWKAWKRPQLAPALSTSPPPRASEEGVPIEYAGMSRGLMGTSLEWTEGRSEGHCVPTPSAADKKVREQGCCCGCG